MFSDCPGWDLYCSGCSWVTQKKEPSAMHKQRAAHGMRLYAFYEGYIG